jgi:ABC-type Fe3+ transport system substrate-binding protein
MNTANIDLNSSLYDFVKKYPATIPFLVSQGLTQVEDETMLKEFGQQVSLKQMLTMRNLNAETFSERLAEVLADHIDSSSQNIDGAKTTRVLGLLPCPVRLPLQESFNSFLENFHALNPDQRLEQELKAASVGPTWMEEHITGITDPEQLPDMFISAGFETFFDKNSIGRFRDTDTFIDATGIQTFNDDFNGIDLKDPRGMYSIISVVPAVFLVNTKLLGDLPCPKTWEDILSPEFEKKVSLPVGDFDLFNGILLSILKLYGDDGVKKLGRSLLKALHPSEMVKSNRKPEPPIVTIMPYFFTRMVNTASGMKAVWPQDGAIISPIFMLTKRSDKNGLKQTIEFFASEATGRILSEKGLFPSVHPAVKNNLPQPAPFQWLGWDYLESHDITKEIETCLKLFEEGQNSHQL